jgi:hypothetical protein
VIQTVSGGTLSAGDTFAAGAQPPTQMVGSATYDFSFVNVSGGTGGGVTSLKPGVPAPTVTVGTSNILVLVVYAPASGDGPPGTSTGATIEQFDMTTGALLSDTFVKVSPDATGALTTSGNVDGYVDTTNTAENIMALPVTSPSNVDFVEWVTLLPASSSSLPTLAVGAHANVSALAFYKTPPAGVPPVIDPCQQSLNSLNQIINDGDRPRLTVAEFNAIKAQLEKCVQEGKLKQTQVTDAINAYLGDLNPPTPPTVK